MFRSPEMLIQWLRRRRTRRDLFVATLTEFSPPVEPLVIRAANDNTAFYGQAFDLKTVVAAMDQDRFEFEKEPTKA